MPFRAFLTVTALLHLSACTPPVSAPKAEAPPPAEAAAATDIRIDNVVANQRLTSPFKVTGTAPGSWYFEAVFQAKLLGADGAVIAEAPAQAQSDWMTEAPVPFAVEFSFSVPADTQATLMLAEDMYGAEDHPNATRIVKIPVVLVAKAPTK